MTTQILAIVILILTCIIGVWKWLKRRYSTKRKLADEASQKLDEAHKNKDKSSVLDAWDRIKRAGRV